MPHFIIECSQNILEQKKTETIIQAVYNTADESGLFEKGDVKVRIKAYEHYTVGNTDDNFIHIFANMMEGRSTIQKKKLSKAIISALNNLFPSVPIISINIRDFEKATYCNKSML